MEKPRKQTYTMDMYLNKMRDKDIRQDADVQRSSGQWEKGMINELIATVLTDDYIPPIILGEETNSQLWIIDGLQRSISLMLFRYGNYKITPTIEDSIIPYRAKARDGKGKIKTDGNGGIIWEESKFDIKNKTYDELPDELKKRFNEYQIETVIHEQCDMKRISKLIKRYNNHTSMNTSQKAFTYIENFARDIRKILDNRFFADCGNYTEKERTKGVLERVVLESVMCMFHLNSWKKQTKQISTYLNENACKEEFDKLNDHLCRLSVIVSKDLKELFTSKDSFIWFALFDKFTALGLDDSRFADFLQAFKNELRNHEVNGRLFDAADKNKGTKDKAVIIEKLNILEGLMNAFLHTGSKELEEMDVFEFIRAQINPDTTQEDVEQYEEVFEYLTLNVDNASRLMDITNRPSFVALIAYSFERDIDLDDWIVSFFMRNHTYIRNQKENYIHMKRDLDQFVLSRYGNKM